MKPTLYTAYKPSDVKWLGDIPAHWEVRRLRNIVEMRVSNVDKHVKEDEKPVRLCNYVDVYKNDYINSKIDFMQATATSEEIERFRLEKDDVLITKDSESWDDIGVPALVTEPASDLISGYHLALLRPRSEKITGGYLLRALQNNSSAYQFHIEAKGVTRYGLSHAGIKSAWLPVPPLPEQSSIIRYLDHATENIRRYISAKERLINLLEEQLQAVIQRAVTRGLDPNIRLKPSGVEWLGNMPEHWKVRRLRNVIDMRVSNVDKHVKEDEKPIRLCNYVDVYKNEYIDEQLDFMRATATAEEIDRFRLEKDDVLITKDSESWDDIGVPSLVKEPASDLISGYHLALLRPRGRQIKGGYLLRALQSKSLSYQFHVAAKGVTRYGLSQADIKSVRLPVPPLDEQAAIVEYLEKATSDFNAATSRAHREIELLKEYRSRLIADVVTGKLDVREAAFKLPEVPDDLSLSDTVDDVTHKVTSKNALRGIFRDGNEKM